MTTIDLYRKHKAGDISREKFLYEVRRDEQLPWITNLTSYDDAVKILKNKGVVTEAKVEEPLKPESKKSSKILKEDWGSSDQATFNNAIHKDLGNPTEMPMPFDSKFESAVEDAVDFWWDEWDEYATDRDGLIDYAKKRYYNAYFPEKFAGFQKMFSETLNEDKKTKKSSKTLTLDYVNPYQFRHGLVYELEQLDDHSDESLAKAKEKVLKNLTKDPTYYTTLLNQKQSSYEFKAPETDAPGMQAKADGTLKKGAGKLDKSNVKDTLGKKEAGDKTPKGVKTMPDKGVTGTQKTIKESLFNEEGGNIKIEKQSDGKYYWTFTSKSGKTNKSYDGFNTSAEAQKDFMYRSKYLKEEEVDVNFENTNETQFEDLMKKYDWYYEMSDNAQKYDAGKLVDRQLQALGSKIGVDKATEIFNRYAPADRKVTSTFFSINEAEVEINEVNTDGLKQMGYSDSDIEDFMDEWKNGGSKLPKKVKDYLDGLYNTILGQLKTKPLREVKVDKHAKLKELLKAKLKEAISTIDIQNSKTTGKPINVSKSNAQDIKALQTAKANFTTYE